MSLLSSPPLKSLKSFVATHLNISWPYALKSYSQEGEDIVLRKLFDGQSNGFYVDVGAHHPFRYSNTQYFYEQGWQGINIDATPGSLENFRRTRHRDINIEAVVGETSGEVSYYLFEDPALNTMSAKKAKETEENQQSRLLKTVKLPLSRIDKILDRNLPVGASIDFMSIDVEGSELEVLRSNNWQKYRPTIIVVEALSNTSLKELFDSPLIIFLERENYAFVGRTINSLYFRRSD